MTVLVMQRGDTYTFDVAVTDAAGEPLDLSGLPITFTAKRNFNDSTPFIEKTEADGIDTGGSGDPLGTMTITIEPTDTDMLTHTERFWWDIEVDNLGDVRTPAQGRLVVRMDLSNVVGSGS